MEIITPTPPARILGQLAAAALAATYAHRRTIKRAARRRLGRSAP